MIRGALRIDEGTAWTIEERLQLLVESIRDYAILMLDSDGTVMTWNLGAERMKGYTAEEIIGCHFSRLYPPAEVQAGKCELALRIAAEHGRFEDEGYRVRKDGSLFWANVTLSAMRDEDGTLIGYAKVTRDLSERKRVEEQAREGEERFRLLVESVKDYAMFTLDPAGNVTTWNSGAERMTGYSSDEVCGVHFSRFYTREDVRSGRAQRDLDMAARDGRFEDEGFRQRKDGSRIWAKVQVTSLHDPAGRLLGFAHIAHDLTEPKRAEEARMRLAQAKEAIRLRDEFLSIASHELRTPLTALELQLQTLNRRLAGAADDTSRRKVNQAIHAARRLANLIDELLNVSRISTGRLSLNLQKFDLTQSAKDVLEQFADTASAAGCSVSLTTEGPVVGTWDKLRMEQVLTNLLANAVKYGARAPVEVTVWSEGGAAVMEVTDDGPGIPKEDLSRIFERFERAHSMRHHGGLGLGLYVARQIAAAHGGTVSARNAEGHGACLTVRVPLAPPRKAEESAP